MVPLDIISDPICPWCFIGWHNLTRALDGRDHPFVIAWHPFQLNPDMDPGGMDRRIYLETKFGGKDQAVQVYGRIAAAAEQAGLDIDFAAIDRTPNTLDAHRLIHWAGVEHRQSAVADALFRAYFQQGRNIGDRDVLVDIADGAGLDAAMIARLLASEADAADTRARDAHARAQGVRGVPAFVLGEGHLLSGAQPPQVWTDILDQIAPADSAS